MHVVHLPQDACAWDRWRDYARQFLAQGIGPEAIAWNEDTQQSSLFGNNSPLLPAAETSSKLSISKVFLELSRSVAAHRDPTRWALLYRMLWRQTLGQERALLAMATDPDVRQAQRLSKAVGRDIHKMHAFVRFRCVGEREVMSSIGTLLTGKTTRECFVAWFEPEHHIVRMAAGFFQKRFASMDWSILTPEECVHWCGETLQFTPGVTRNSITSKDALEDLWRSYYRSIFNPARLKTKAMQSEMPKKYWRNLPEASLIPELVSESKTRTAQMLGTVPAPMKPAPHNAYLSSLHRQNTEHPEDES